MPPTQESSEPDDLTAREEALARLTEELSEARSAGGTLDFDALAEKYEISREEVRSCASAVKALGDALRPSRQAPGAAADRQDLSAPALPSDYVVLEEIGRGGMGVVYRCRQRSLDREVAVKVLRPGETVHGDPFRRFQKEAKILAKLRHPHIVTIYEVGEAQGAAFYSMDLIQGESLANLIQQMRITATRAVRILGQVASAIAHTHSHGLIHRDLKPANVLVNEDGDAFVADFGLARDLEVAGQVSAKLTRSGHVMGTPAYMAPEQARGDAARIGEATDIYALGAILYECLTGRAPFAGGSLADTIYDVIHRDPVRPRKAAPKVPLDLEIICRKAMAKEPEHRYGTAQAFLEDLERFEEGRPIRARPPSLTYRARNLLRRAWLPLGSAGVAAAVVLALGLFLLLPRLRRTPAFELTIAEEDHEAGEHRAAILRMERALTKARAERGLSETYDGGRPPDEFMRVIYGRLARCRREFAEEVRDQGNPREAIRLLEAARSAHGQALGPGDSDSELEQILWLLATIPGEIGEVQEAVEGFQDLGRALAIRRNGAPIISLRDFHVYGPLLDRVGPFLMEPDHPLHEATVGLLILLLDNPGEDTAREVITWLAGHGDGAIPIVVARLRAYGDDGSGGAPASGADPGHLREVVRRIAPFCGENNLEDALLRACRDETLSVRGRAHALSLLADAGDLPPRGAPGDGGDPGPPGERTLQAWQEVRDLSRLDGYRKRIELAMEDLDGDPEPTGMQRLREWLEDRTGFTISPDPAGRARSEGEINRLWQDWWTRNRGEDPRTWLTRALDIDRAPGEEDLPDLLENFLESPGPRLSNPNPRVRLRAMWHHLLRLVAPEDVQAPLWIREEPEDLAMAWHEALREHRRDDAHQLRLARITLLGDFSRPSIDWEETKPIRVGEEVEIRRGGPSPYLQREPDRSLLLSWSPYSMLRRAWGVQVSVPGLVSRETAWWPRKEGLLLRTDLSWRRDQLRVGFWEGDSPSRTRSLSRTGTLLSDKGRVRMQHLQVHTDRLGRLKVQALLGILEPPRSRAEAWSIGDWRTRLAEDASKIADELAAAAPLDDEEHGLYTDLVRDLARAACYLSGPELVEPLARIHRALSGDGTLGAPGILSVARMLSGDHEDAHGSSPSAVTSGLPFGPYTRFTREAVVALWSSVERATPDFDPEDCPLARETLSVVRESRAGSDPRELAFFGILGLVLAITFVFRSLGSRYSPSQRSGAASVALAIGLIFIAVRLPVMGSDVLPDAVGYALASAGALVLGRFAAGRAHTLAPMGFGAALLMDVIGRAGGLPGLFLPLSVLFASLGVLGLPLLGMALETARPAEPRGFGRGYAGTVPLLLFVAVAACLTPHTPGPISTALEVLAVGATIPLICILIWLFYTRVSGDLKVRIGWGSVVVVLCFIVVPGAIWQLLQMGGLSDRPGLVRAHRWGLGVMESIGSFETLSPLFLLTGAYALLLALLEVRGSVCRRALYMD